MHLNELEERDFYLVNSVTQAVPATHKKGWVLTGARWGEQRLAGGALEQPHQGTCGAEFTELRRWA